MNIKQAAEQIEGAVRAYLARDAHGICLVPPEMQRPLLLMGPPGIGKTAVVSQIARGLGVNFVSYSITHHTRQSALGLPYIAQATYGGREYRVSRYTMSEIIGATYDAIQDSGIEEGILFLDEVNCASETLMPSMLQFLQYKTFGQHHLPAGWVVVCAGNPPEYNRAARDFDPAMRDRLKRIDIEPDLDVWMEYATTHGVHPAITTYLRGKPNNFYRVRAGTSGARIVTARGWEDLSRMMFAYRHEGLAIGPELVSQYLQDPEVAEDFSLYFELFAKYEDDYKVSDILDGTEGREIRGRAGQAAFDERIALVNLLLAALLDETHEVVAREAALARARAGLEGVKTEFLSGGGAAREASEKLAREARTRLDETQARGAGDPQELLVLGFQAEYLEDVRAGIARLAMGGGTVQDAPGVAAQTLGELQSALGQDIRQASSHVDNTLAFLDGVFGEGQELLVLVTHLAVDPAFMRFVAAHGSTSFARHGSGLMLHERGLDLLEQIEKLG